MYPAFTSGIVLDCRKETKIKHLIKIRKIEMGIRDLPEQKKKWCWHKWEFLGMNFTLGDHFKCVKCGKEKHKNYY